MARRGPKPRLKAVLPLAQDWTAPPYLGKVARAEFDRVVALLREKNTLERTDSRLVVRRAEVAELAEASYRQWSAGELFLESDRGNLSPHPAIKTHLSATALLQRLDAELGLTPASAKVSAAPQGTPAGYGAWGRLLGGGESS